MKLEVSNWHLKRKCENNSKNGLRCQIGISEELEVADCDFKRNKEKGKFEIPDWNLRRSTG